MSYAPYSKDTASAEDRIAWALCQIIDDDAPLRWTRYRSAAVCIAQNLELMADLHSLPPPPKGNHMADTVIFQYAIGARIRERNTGIQGAITHQVKDSVRAGYWIVFIDNNGTPCERYVNEADAEPA